MNMIDAVKSVLANYANFNGRARRSEYWWWWLAQVLVVLVLVVPSAAFQTSETNSTSTVTTVLFVAWFVGTIIPNLSVTVRRLHDSNKTGWLYLLNLIPYLGALILLVLTILPGTQGENQYGPDPKGINASDIFA